MQKALLCLPALVWRAPYSPLRAFSLLPSTPPSGASHQSSQSRLSSHSPLGAHSMPYRKKVTIHTLRSMHRKREPITVLTAHDFPSAHVADAAGMDIVLVGDSLAMVALGMEDTSEVLVEEMLLHCKSVARATKSAFTVSSVASMLSMLGLLHPLCCLLSLCVVVRIVRVLTCCRWATSPWVPMRSLLSRL